MQCLPEQLHSQVCQLSSGLIIKSQILQPHQVIVKVGVSILGGTHSHLGECYLCYWQCFYCCCYWTLIPGLKGLIDEDTSASKTSYYDKNPEILTSRLVVEMYDSPCIVDDSRNTLTPSMVIAQHFFRVCRSFTN